MSRDWSIYLRDMKEFCDKILKYTKGISREEFDRHGIIYDATIRNVELIGEAARQIPDEVRSVSPEIEWSKIMAVRNILIHGYFGIDDDILWDIVKNKIEPLRQELEDLERELE